jgi:peptidoglycan/LPS O-acetylase OafA/YrhL
MASHFGAFPGFEHAGNFGVQVFFALSGWLIGGILLNITTSGLPRFYFNRAVRIWVPYFLALLFLALGSVAHHDIIGGKWVEFVAYKATFVWNIFGTPQLETARDLMPLKGTGNHFWSVNAEEQFYLLSPVLLVLMPRFGRRPLVWATLSALACYAGSTYAAVMLGVFFATVFERAPGFHLRPAFQVGALFILAVCAVVIFSGLNYGSTAPIAGSMIVLLLARQGKKSPVAGLFGGLSYELYLNHWIGGFIVQVVFLSLGGSKSSPWALAPSLALSVVIAAGLYWFIDRPLRRMRLRLYTPTLGRTAMILGYAILAAGISFGLAVHVTQ